METEELKECSACETSLPLTSKSEHLIIHQRQRQRAQARQMVSHHPPPYSDLAVRPVAPSAPPPTARRASSTASGGRSGTRRHRHPRSHHAGSSSILPQNEFPIFSHTGDVEIVITSPSGRKENRYLLHRLILSQYSGYFEAGTRAQWNAKPPEDASEKLGGGLARISEVDSATAGSSSRASSRERRPSQDVARRKWYYVLDWVAAGDDELPMLVQKDNDRSTSIFGGDSYSERPPPVHSKPPTSNANFFRNLANFSTRSSNDRSQPSSPIEPGDEVLKDYDNLFRTMYQYSPSFDNVNIATAYTECKALLHLADMYDALEIVGTRVDHHLLRFGSRLFKQIAKYPPSYLKLGYLARSKTIFTEAFIHVVGRWPLAAPQLRGQVDANLMELLEDKVDELHELQDRVESKLWRLNLTTSRGERVTPSNDFLSWLAISLFRQWLAENTTPTPQGILKPPNSSHSNPPPPPPTTGANHAVSQRVQAPPPPPPSATTNPSSPGRVYRLLGSTDPTAYLARDELKRFLKTPQPQLGIDFYSRDNLRRFERRVDEIRHIARDLVKPLTRNFLELDLRDFGPVGLGYLTCTRVEPTDLPWDE